VTPQQLAAAGAMSAQSPDLVALVAHDGRRRTWQELAGGHPVVVVFIKKDCPCNVEFEPFFHRLYRAYRGSVRFVGVIDGGVETARRYAENNQVPYLVLADPERALISCFRAENGAYVALVTPAEVLDTLWPGCSAEMMRDLSRRIAEIASVEEQPIETTGLPSALTTGCPFAG
jgi:peroxiredoxin